MKNLVILLLMIVFGFAAHAQLAAITNKKPAKNFKLNSMEVNFLNLDELLQFKDKLSNGESGLETLKINNNFKFVYTIAETVQVGGKDMSFGDIKIEITDQPNRTVLIKEIHDSIDGIIEIRDAKF